MWSGSAEFGDSEIRRWIVGRKGRGLTTAQVAPWVTDEVVRG